MPFITTPERYGRAELAGPSRCRLEDIETILELRFQDAGTRLMPEIRLINDEERLKKILRAAATVPSTDDLRTLCAGGSAGQSPHGRCPPPLTIPPAPPPRAASPAVAA